MKRGFQRLKIDGAVLRDRRRARARQEAQARHRGRRRPPRRAPRHGEPPRRKFRDRAGTGRRPRDRRIRRRAPRRGSRATPRRILFSSKFACPVSGFTIAEIEPRLFSFNNPFGACPACGGLGSELTVDREPGRSRSAPDPAQGRRRALGEIDLALLSADAGGARPALQVPPRRALGEPAGKGARRHPLRLGRRGGALRLRRRPARPTR